MMPLVIGAAGPFIGVFVGLILGLSWRARRGNKEGLLNGSVLQTALAGAAMAFVVSIVMQTVLR